MLDHLDLNVSDLERAVAFYEPLLDRLSYRVTAREPGWVILTPPDGGAYVTLVQTAAEHRTAGFHRKRAGVNHLALRAASREAVDQMHHWLSARSVPILYGGPMHMQPARYALFFEDPDRLKLEYVHRGDLG